MGLNASSNCAEDSSDSVTTLYVASNMANSSPAHCLQKLNSTANAWLYLNEPMSACSLCSCHHYAELCHAS